MWRFLELLAYLLTMVVCRSVSVRSDNSGSTGTFGQLSIENTSAVTSVLVAWQGDMAEEYTVMYKEGDQCPSFNTSPNSPEEVSERTFYAANINKMINVTTSSIILVSLSPSTSYFVRVCNTSSNRVVLNCCCQTFQTSATDSDLVNQVQDVRVHVYRPMINSDNVSAQVIWTALDAAVRPTSYDVQITTADEDRKDITGKDFFNLIPQKTFTNIVTRTENNELVYPIQTNRLYIVQVRGRNSTTNFSWSEPVWINTKNEVFTPELYILSNAAASLVFENRTVYTNDEIRSPFTLDKRNRVVFYVNQAKSVIYRANVDRPFKSKTFFMLQNVDDAQSFAQSLAYDWIARRLYVTVTFNNNMNEIIYLIDDDSDSSDRQPVSVYSTESMISETVVNPFTGLLHWTEKDSDSEYKLKRLNLETSQSDERRSDLIFQTLAENVERRCVYVIEDGPEIVSDGENCTEATIHLSSQFDESSSNCNVYLSVDEQGIHTFKRRRILYYAYDEMQDIPQSITQLQINAVISGFDTLSPGAQPLPKQSCLSPNISGSVSIDVTERTATSFHLEWTAPNVIQSQDCQSMVVSVPPIMYIIEVSGEGYENKTTQFSRSLLVTGLDMFQSYHVRIRARTEFTIGEDAVLAEKKIEPFRADTATATPTTTPSTTSKGTNLTNSQTSAHATTDSSLTRNVTTSSDFSSPSLSFLSSTPDPSTPQIIVNLTSSTSSSSSGTDSSSATQTPHSSPPPTDPSSNSGNVVVVAGISGGVAVLIVVLVGVIIIITALICVKSRSRKTFEKSYSMNEETERYVRQRSDLPPDGSASTGEVLEPSPYESPLTLSTNKPLTDPLVIQQNQDRNSSVDPYAIPSDSLQEYRFSLRQTPLGQEYEVPVSQTNTLASRTDPEPRPTVNMYSTLDDATIEKNRYVTRMDSNPSVPPKYASLYPPNMDEPHSYVRTPSPIKIAPELYSEPVVSARMSSYKEENKRKSRNSNTVHPGSLDNPVYFESNNAKKTTENAYFTLERVDTGIPQSNQAQSDVPSPNPNPTYFVIERPPVNEAQTHPKPDPTYFEVQPPQDLTNDRTQTTLGPKPEPTYFELQPPKDSTIDHIQAQSDTPAPKPEPMYFEVEKLKHSSGNALGNPVYFELDHSHKQQQGSVDTSATTDQHEHSGQNGGGEPVPEANHHSSSST